MADLSKPSQIVDQIKNKKSNFAFMLYLLNNDKEQIFDILRQANPKFFLAYENELHTGNNEDSAKLIISKWREGKLIIPKANFNPKPDEVTLRLKAVKEVESL